MMDMAALLDSAIKHEGDQTRRSMALPLVELLGRMMLPQDGYGDDPRALTKTAVNEYGVGVTPVKRLASVHPLSIGDGVVAETAAYGDPNSTGDPFLLGRLASGQYDSWDLFWARKTFTGRALPVGVTVDDPDLKATVNIPTNRNVGIIAFAYASALASTVNTQIDMAIRIGGSETVGSPSLGNTDGAVGPWVSGGLDTSVQPYLVPHARVFSIASDTQEFSGQNVNVRWSSHGGSGNSRIRSAWLFGIRIVF